MKKLLILVLFLSAKAMAQNITPIQFNDKLTQYADSMFHQGENWGRVFSKCINSGDYKDLRAANASIKSYLDKSVSELEKTKDVKNSKAFRLAMIDFLKFEKGLAVKGFDPIGKFNSATPTDTINVYVKLLQTMSETEGVYMGNLRSEQKKYADANGFEIEVKKDE